MLDERTLGFVDYRGNRQYISLGNLSADDRVSLILMDYPGRRRMKIYARAEPCDLDGDPALAARLATPGYKARPERGYLLHLKHLDWNCPQHIAPRFTEAEIAAATQPMLSRLDALETENATLRARLAIMEGD